MRYASDSLNPALVVLICPSWSGIWQEWCEGIWLQTDIKNIQAQNHSWLPLLCQLYISAHSPQGEGSEVADDKAGKYQWMLVGKTMVVNPLQAVCGQHQLSAQCPLKNQTENTNTTLYKPITRLRLDLQATVTPHRENIKELEKVKRGNRGNTSTGTAYTLLALCCVVFN